MIDHGLVFHACCFSSLSHVSADIAHHPLALHVPCAMHNGRSPNVYSVARKLFHARPQFLIALIIVQQ